MSDEWDEAERVTKRHASGKFGKLDNGSSCTVAWFGGRSPSSSTGRRPDWCRARGRLRALQEGPADQSARPHQLLRPHRQRDADSGREGLPSCATSRSSRRSSASPTCPSRITRTGTGKNTKYLILPDKTLTAEQKARIAKASPHNLSEQDDGDGYGEDDSAAGSESGARTNSDVISSAVRDEFIARLQALRSEEALFTFLGTFHCERISDVLASDEQRARQSARNARAQEARDQPFS